MIAQKPMLGEDAGDEGIGKDMKAMITIRPGKMVGAGVPDIQERERGVFRTTGGAAARATLLAARDQLAAEPPDAATTSDRSLGRFTACAELNRMRASPPLAAAACQRNGEQAAASLDGSAAPGAAR